jgi:hypothetical protein
MSFMDGNRGGMVVQMRDRDLFRDLAFMRVIDREQVKRVAGFTSTTRANARLLALVHAGMLRRFWLGSNRSGRKAIYALSAKGAALVGVPLRGPRRANEQVFATDAFIAHQLLVNTIYCDVKYGEKPKGIAFLRWQTFHEPIHPNLRLIPDGYCELSTSTGTTAAFIEIDRATESLALWNLKVRNYLQLAMSGDFERQFHQTRFRVLVIANSRGRLQSIRKTVATTTDKIFWFATLDEIESQGFFRARWLRPRGDQQQEVIKETT